MYRNYIKRLMDILLSSIGLIIAAIPILIISVLIKVESPGPSVFKQKRLGKDGKIFEMYKFRTMCLNAESQGSGVYSGKGDPRVTKVGRILRATSLDEILQAVNILKGEMSIIGPRPPLTYHPWPLHEYTDEQRKMFDVRPGITGWAQINGRKEVPWPERIEMNVWYVNNVSFLLDLKIFFKTIAKVFTNANNENTTETVCTGSAEIKL